MARQSPLSLDQVLEGGILLASGHTLVAHALGTIECPTGELVACDPLAGFTRAEGFEARFIPGTYDASLRIIQPASSPPEVTFFDVAQLVVARPGARCVRWEIALVPFEDTDSLRAGQLPGIRVETATAAVFDVAVQDWIDHDDVIERCRAAKNRSPGGGVTAPHDDRPVSFAVSTSGAGDGSYPAFVGFAATGDAVALILDFRMVPIVTPPVLSADQLDARVAAVTADLTRAIQGEAVDDLGLSVDEVGGLGDLCVPLVGAVERILGLALAGTVKARGFIPLAMRAATVLASLADRDANLADRYLRFLTAGDTSGAGIALAIAREMAWTGREAEVTDLIDRVAATAAEPDVIVAALGCLGELPGPDRAWERYAGHPAAVIQRALIAALVGRVGAQRTSRETFLRVVSPLLRADDSGVRAHALSFVASYADDPAKRRPVVGLLGHADAETALAAALALARQQHLAPDERDRVRTALERFAGGGDPKLGARAKSGLATLIRNS